MGNKIDQSEPIILLGAGLAGSLMALYLAKRGFKVEVYERRPDMRKTDLYAGKSINLAISVRGLHAMQEVGLLDQVMDMCIPMRGRMVHDTNRKTQFQPYSKDGETAINSISRGELNMLLMNAADAYDNLNLHFNYRCLGIDTRTGAVRLRNENTGEKISVRGQTAIATDGAFSGIRSSLMRTPRFNFSQTYHTHAYKELSFPAAANQGWLVEKNALHIWPRGNFMLIALPNLDGSFTVTLFYPRKGAGSFEELETPAAAEAFFQKEFPDALELIPNFREEFFNNPTADLVTVKCSPWSYQDKCVLMGDAAHAVVPFYGQGMNAAFEDCTVLNDCLNSHGNGDWDDLFQAYEARRIANGHAIAELAIEHYIEMRDSTGDTAWLFRKAIEHRLERTFPEYISEYEMVSFTRIPYAEAQRRGRINEEILHELAKGINSPEQIDLVLAKALIAEKLPQ
ncbi:MAG TPA: FAD-dependent monooxygenase [Bacteroidetes bacterium]|nr:FAD-dependent monooxygenase [Bacteroidota bacterium]